MRYRHIDALFGEPGRNVIDWELIETHYAGPDAGGALRSRRAGSPRRRCCAGCRPYSRRNNIYKAFREVGRVIRTVQLLRFLSDPQLRRRITAATNKVESYNKFSAWCRFGNDGVIADNDPDEQEKIIKFTTLLTNAVIFHTTLDMMTVDPRADRRGLADHRRGPRRALAVHDRPHPALRRLRHRRDRPDPRAFDAHLGIDLAAAS